MRPERLFQHVAGIVGGEGFAEDAAFQTDLGIGTDDDGGARIAGGDEFGFGDGQALDEVVGGFARVGRLVDSGRDDSRSGNRRRGGFRRGEVEVEARMSFMEIPEGKNTIAQVPRQLGHLLSRRNGSVSGDPCQAVISA